MSRQSLFLVVCCVVVFLSGCATTGKTPLWSKTGPQNIKFPKFPLAKDSERPKLKHPERVQLAYARLQEQLGNLDEARRFYEQVLGEKPKSVEAIVGLARLDHLSGRDSEAEKGFARALELAPENPQVLDSAGQFYAEREDWSRATQLFQKAVELSPDDENIRYHLAVALVNNGQVEAALAHFSKIVGEAAAHYNVAVLLQQKGKTQEAERHLLAALAKDPRLTQAQKWLEEIRRRRDAATLTAGAGKTEAQALSASLESVQPAGFTQSSKTSAAATKTSSSGPSVENRPEVQTAQAAEANKNASNVVQPEEKTSFDAGFSTSSAGVVGSKPSSSANEPATLPLPTSEQFKPEQVQNQKLDTLKRSELPEQLEPAEN